MFALGQSLGFFTNALIFWYGSTLLRTGEYDITKFFVWYHPFYVIDNWISSSWTILVPQFPNGMLTIVHLHPTFPKPSHPRSMSTDSWNGILSSIPGAQKGNESNPSQV